MIKRDTRRYTVTKLDKAHRLECRDIAIGSEVTYTGAGKLWQRVTRSFGATYTDFVQNATLIAELQGVAEEADQ